VVMSVMNGFDREMESRILAAVPHIRLFDEHGVQQSDTLRDTLVQQPNVRAVMPFTRLEGMLTHRGKTRPVEVMGLEPSLADPFMGVFISPDLMGQLAVHSNGLLMAGEIAKKLSLSAGDRVTLLVPASGGNGLQQAPKVSTFTVLGTFDTRTAGGRCL
jgi:lipoprotein-releasing system permease protein